MKKKDFITMKTMDVEALKKEVEKRQGQIADMTIEKHTGKLKNLKMIQNVKIEIAQLLTVMRQKGILAEYEAMAVVEAPEILDAEVKEIAAKKSTTKKTTKKEQVTK